MLWSNSHGLWQTLPTNLLPGNTHIVRSRKFLIVVLGLLGIMMFKPDFQIFNQVMSKLIQESGHPRIVRAIGMKETNF